MDLNQLVMIGIGVFILMALVALFNLIHTFRKTFRQPQLQRLGRRISALDPARDLAQNLVREVASSYPDAMRQSRERGRLTPDLENALVRAQRRYLSHVAPRYGELFIAAVEEVIFAPKSDTASTAAP